MSGEDPTAGERLDAPGRGRLVLRIADDPASAESRTCAIVLGERCGVSESMLAH
jgi:hypothetical protein